MSNHTFLSIFLEEQDKATWFPNFKIWSGIIAENDNSLRNIEKMSTYSAVGYIFDLILIIIDPRKLYSKFLKNIVNKLH